MEVLQVVLEQELQVLIEEQLELTLQLVLIHLEAIVLTIDQLEEQIREIQQLVLIQGQLLDQVAQDQIGLIDLLVLIHGQLLDQVAVQDQTDHILLQEAQVEVLLQEVVHLLAEAVLQEAQAQVEVLQAEAHQEETKNKI